MSAIQELHAALQNQRFATGNDDLLLGRAIMEVLERVEALEAKLAIMGGMTGQAAPEASSDEASQDE